MKKGKFQDIRWKNPKTGLVQFLGEHIGNGKFVNFTYSDLEFELSLLENPRNGKVLGAGAQGNVFLHSCGNKSRAVKVYRSRGYGIKGTGIAQFRASRKIKQLRYETPEVYVATEDILVMGYMPYENLDSYMHKLEPKDMAYMNRQWLDMMGTMWKQIRGERIDLSPINGYIKHGIHTYDLGIIDQG